MGHEDADLLAQALGLELEFQPLDLLAEAPVLGLLGSDYLLLAARGFRLEEPDGVLDEPRCAACWKS